MLDLKLDEQIVDDVVLKLKDNMPARVQRVNELRPAGPDIQAPLGDGEGGGNPVDGSSYYTSGVQSIPAAPAIIVAPGDTDFSAVANEGPHSLHPLHTVHVWILDQDADRQTLGRKLMRQSNAVIGAVWDDEPRQRLANSAYRIMPLRTSPGTVFEPDAEDAWRGFYQVVFAAVQFEG